MRPTSLAIALMQDRAAAAPAADVRRRCLSLDPAVRMAAHAEIEKAAADRAEIQARAEIGRQNALKRQAAARLRAVKDARVGGRIAKRTGDLRRAAVGRARKQAQKDTTKRRGARNISRQTGKRRNSPIKAMANDMHFEANSPVGGTGIFQNS